MSDFVKRILASQQADQDRATVTFQRIGIDKKTHGYEGERFIRDQEICITMKQDGTPVQYPAETILDMETIIKELVEIYKSHNLQMSIEYNEWEGYFQDCARVNIEARSKIEILAAWMELIEHLCLISTIAVGEIAGKKYGKKPRYIGEKIIGQESDIRKEPIKGLLKYQSPSAIYRLNLPGESAKAYRDRGVETLKPGFREYLTSFFKDRLSNRFPLPKVPNPIYNEPAFRTNLEELYVQTQVPPSLVKVGIADVPSGSNSIPDAVEHLKKEIDKYAQDLDTSNVPPAPPTAYFVESPLGTGKSVLCQVLFRELAAAYLNKSLVIPLIIAAKKVESPDFKGMVAACCPDDDAFLRAVRTSCVQKKRKLVIIVDGLDECQNQHIRSAIISECAHLIHDNVWVLVTARPVENIWNHVLQSMPGMTRYTLKYDSGDLFQNLHLPMHFKNHLHFMLLSIFSAWRISSLLESPLFIDLLENFWQRLREKTTQPQRQIPQSISPIIEGFYRKVLDYAQRNRGIAPDTSLAHFEEECQRVAVTLAMGRPISAIESTVGWLKKIGILIGIVERPEFLHSTFYFDFLARAIASNTPPMTPADIFTILAENSAADNSIGQDAISLAIEKGTISQSHFDVFENLFDDNSLHFSGLKARVWHARGKGAPPFLRNALKSLISNSTASLDAKSILYHIKVEFPELEDYFLREGDLEMLKNRDLSPEGYVKLCREFIKQKQSNPITFPETLSDSWFSAFLQSPAPIEFITNLGAYVSFTSDQLVMVYYLFEESAFLFLEQYFRLVLKRDKAEFQSLLEALVLYKPMWGIFIKLASEPDMMNELLSTFIDLGDDREEIVHHTSGRNWNFEQGLYRDFIETIFPLVLRSLERHVSVKVLEYLLYFDEGKRFQARLEQEIPHYLSILNFIQERPSERSCDWFLQVIARSDTLINQGIGLLRNPDLVARLLDHMHIWSIGITNLKKNPRKTWKAVSSHLKNMLEADPRLETYVAGGKYSLDPSLLNKEFRDLGKLPVIINARDIRRFNLLENYEFAEDYLYRCITKKAQNYILRSYLKTLTSNANNGMMREAAQHYAVMDIVDIVFVSFVLSFLESDLVRSGSFLKELIQSPDPHSFLRDILTGNRSDESFISTFWDFLLPSPAMVTQDPRSTTWWEYLEAFQNVELPRSKQDEILGSEVLCLQFLHFPHMEKGSLKCIHPSLFHCYEAIVKQQPAVVKTFLDSIFMDEKKTGWDSFPPNLHLLVARNFQLYATYFDDPSRLARLFQVNLPDDYWRELFKHRAFVQFLLKYSSQVAPNQEEYFILSRLVPGEVDLVREVLRDLPPQVALRRFYEVFIPCDRVRWVQSLEIHQADCLQKLNRLGINPVY